MHGSIAWTEADGIWIYDEGDRVTARVLPDLRYEVYFDDTLLLKSLPFHSLWLVKSVVQHVFAPYPLEPEAGERYAVTLPGMNTFVTEAGSAHQALANVLRRSPGYGYRGVTIGAAGERLHIVFELVHEHAVIERI